MLFNELEGTKAKKTEYFGASLDVYENLCRSKTFLGILGLLWMFAMQEKWNDVREGHLQYIYSLYTQYA